MCRQICEDREVGKFWRSKIFRGQGGRQIWEVSEVGMFGRLGRSGNLGDREVWKDWEGGRIGRMLSPVMNGFLQLQVHCVSYHFGDYRTKRLVHSFTGVLHVVQIHINITLLFIM
jgi:hypothetical protein